MTDFEEQNINVESACVLAKYAILKKLGRFNSYDLQFFVLTVLVHSICTRNKTLDWATSKQTAKHFCERLESLIDETQNPKAGNASNRLN